jgi:phosphoribosyl 1,2-cyclic phosphate phosphodiesterase
MSLLKILGCGSSTGTPVLGCDCKVCCSKEPKNFRTRSSALYQRDDGFTILIDVSPDFRFQALSSSISRIDAILLTHSHVDHIFGLDDVRPYNFKTGLSIPVYGTQKTLNEVRHYYKYIFESEAHSKSFKPLIELIEISDETSFSVQGTEIVPFRMFHADLATTGFKIESIAYATDCNLLTTDAMRVLSESQFIVLDALGYRKSHVHFTIDEACKILKELNPNKAWLTHLSHKVDYFELISALPTGIEPAFDGLKIQL